MKINEKLYQQVVRKCSDIGDLIAFGPDHGGCDTERMVLASAGGEFEVHRVVACVGGVCDQFIAWLAVSVLESIHLKAPLLLLREIMRR